MHEDKFEVNHETIQGGHVLYLRGELDLSTASQLRSILESLAMEKNGKLVLNLRNLKYIDSTGMGVIISALKTCDQAGMSLTVEETPSQIQRLLDLTGITKLLTGVNNL